MINFEYKGFLGSYEISKLSNNLYAAEGNVRKKADSISKEKKFYSENLNKLEVQKDILNLIEKYVDYELNQVNK